MSELVLPSGHIVQLDNEDWVEFSIYNIHLVGKGYAGFYKPGKTRKTRIKYFLHKEIYRNIDATYEGIVDHEDRDRLNCQRYNLRPATKSENGWNGSNRVNNTSGHRGVSWSDSHQKWWAQIRVNSNPKHIGYYDDLDEAIIARKKAEIEYHGQFSGE